MQIWTLTISHKHGTDLMLYWTEQGARDSLYSYVAA
jgi:hypothetical protein